MQDRDVYLRIWRELASDKSMVFVAGPRQSGKTTLSKIISSRYANSVYFNWDIPEQRLELLENPSFFESVARRDPSTPLVVLDEVHKYRDWKNYLKGVYDQFGGQYHFLVCGSGRLDIYQRGGDSLAGRYLQFHLWPFTVAELGGRNRDHNLREFLERPLEVDMENRAALAEIWAGLSSFSGFPEPFLAGRSTAYRRWSRTYSRQLVREDIRDLSGVRSVRELETLYDLLPSKIGSPLSVPSLARDLKVSYNTVQSWLALLERFFLSFSIGPWTSRIARAIQKERKIYLWDAPRIKNEAARFENLVALELYRAVTAWTELGHGEFSLHFIKNKEQQEVDFLVANEGKPVVLVEAKLADEHPSTPLRKFQTMLNVPAVQLVQDGETYRLLGNPNDPGGQILVAPACQWLAGLP